MNRKRPRKDISCVSKRHLKRLAAQKSEIVCDSLLSMTATSSQSNVDYTENLETVSTVNSVINIESTENTVTENHIVHEWNENNDILNVQYSCISDFESEIYIVSENANISDDNLKSYLAS